MCKLGDLVLIPFPFSDQPIAKRRPVLVLTMPDERGDFIGLAITSVTTPERSIILEADSLVSGSLPRRSWLRLDKVFTLNSVRVEGVFAHVDPTFIRQAIQKLCANLGFDSGGGSIWIPGA